MANPQLIIRSTEYSMKILLKACLGNRKYQKRGFLRKRIGTYIDRLIPEKNYFVILECIKPINDNECIYLQTLKRSDAMFCVEVQLKDGDSFKHYRRYEYMRRNVKQIFEDFLQGKMPNIETWKDVTAEIKTHIEKLSIERKIGSNL